MASVSAQQYMENYLYQINYPQIGVLLETNPQNASQSRVYFTQRRFLLPQEIDPELDKPSPFGY